MSKNVETALYSEEGWEAKVEILENNSNGEWEKLLKRFIIAGLSKHRQTDIFFRLVAKKE